MRPRSTIVDRIFACAFAIIGIAPIGASASPAPGGVSDPEPPAIVTPERVWELAESASTPDAIAPVLEPGVWEGLGAERDLIDSLALLRTNLDKREAQRRASIEETRAELGEHIAAFDADGNPVELSDALASAVTLQMLMGDDGRFFADETIRTLIETGAREAHAAEERGDWIIASELYYRLDTLHETERIYRDDVDRLTRRLGMIRLYAPERLWELRNERRLAEGLDALPPYNPYGDNYIDKLEGITALGVRTAIQRAAAQHVGRRSDLLPDGVTMGELIGGGLDAVRTMVTTTDLSEVFPGLRSPRTRAEFLASIDSIRERYSGRAERASAFDLRLAVDSLIGASRDTVRIMPEALLHEFGNGAMGELDEFSAIIWPDEVARFQRSTHGEFVGIGIRIQHDELMNIKVVTPLEGTPAQRAGLLADDIITKVDGISAVGLGLDQAVEVITGPPGTEVSITVEREREGADKPEEHEFTITRARIDIPTVKGWSKTGPRDEDWDYFIDAHDGVGYIRLTGFTEDTTGDLDRAIESMKARGLEALILDLRYNPGGLLDQAVKVSSRFVPSGLIVKTVDASGVTQDRENARRVREDHWLGDIPVVVLVNEGSASASEIVSGSIQAAADGGMLKALVVGQRTFGKGSVQNVFVLPGGRSAMKLTTQYYRLDSDRMIHRLPGATQWGVEPDLRVEMLPEQNAEALLARRDADIYLSDADNTERPDPDDLIRNGVDLQVQTALVLLQTQVQDEIASMGR